jgi:hypothetical protein
VFYLNGAPNTISNSVLAHAIALNLGFVSSSHFDVLASGQDRIVVNQLDDQEGGTAVTVTIKSDGTKGSAGKAQTKLLADLNNPNSSIRKSLGDNYNANKAPGKVSATCETDASFCSSATHVSVSFIALFAAFLAFF